MKEMAANINEFAFDYLDAPAIAVGSRNWITPAHELEQAFFPYPDTIIDAIHTKIMPLAGHVPTHNFTDAEHIARAKKGI